MHANSASPWPLLEQYYSYCYRAKIKRGKNHDFCWGMSAVGGSWAHALFMRRGGKTKGERKLNWCPLLLLLQIWFAWLLMLTWQTNQSLPSLFTRRVSPSNFHKDLCLWINDQTLAKRRRRRNHHLHCDDIKRDMDIFWRDRMGQKISWKKKFDRNIGWENLTIKFSKKIQKDLWATGASSPHLLEKSLKFLWIFLESFFGLI